MSTIFPTFPRLPAEQELKIPIGDGFPIMKLPMEIRCMIWDYALPEARVYEVMDSPNAKQRTPATAGLMFANVNHEPPPALSAVCRESRSFVLRHYQPLTLSTTTKYVDLSRDILLLEPYLLVKRLLRTLHFLSQIPLVRDNVTRLALGTSYGLHTGICHPVLSWKVSKNNVATLLARLSKLPRLKKLIFVVHQEFQFEFHFRLPYGGLYSGNNAALRPQLVHQGYRFKFDIESHINYNHPHHPHHNEFMYYPLPIDEDKDDCFDREDPEEGGEWCDPWPTNDDWRRFRRRFQRAIHLSTNDRCTPGTARPENIPVLEGASLLWRYTKAR